MTDAELKAETQRLLTYSDTLINANRAPENSSPGKQLIGHALSGCLALVFAGIPAWIASNFLDKQGILLVFSAMIVFYGCLEISWAIESQSVAHSKLLDYINAHRAVLVDLSNKVGAIAEREQV